MKVSEAIAKADELRLNTMGDEIKAQWLCDLDGQLAEMMRDSKPPANPAERFAGGEERPASGRSLAREGEAEQSEPGSGVPVWPDRNTWPGEDAELLMPAPHEMVYVYYLAARIDYYNQEGELYANDMTIYNAAMADARAWWRRNHAPRRRENWRI